MAELSAEMKAAGYKIKKLGIGNFYVLRCGFRRIDDDESIDKLIHLAYRDYAVQKRRQAKKLSARAKDLAAPFQSAEPEAGETPRRPLHPFQEAKSRARRHGAQRDAATGPSDCSLNETPPELAISESFMTADRSEDSRRAENSIDQPRPPKTEPEPASNERARAALEKLPVWRRHDETPKAFKATPKANAAELVSDLECIYPTSAFTAERVVQVVRAIVDGRDLESLEGIGFPFEQIQEIEKLFGHLASRVARLRPFERTDFYRALGAALSGLKLADLDTPNRQGQRIGFAKGGGPYKRRTA